MQKQRLSPIDLDQKIDYKDVDLLKNFITEQGKILPQTLTKAKLKQQRALARSVKQARVLGLLPFVHNAFDRTRL